MADGRLGGWSPLPASISGSTGAYRPRHPDGSPKGSSRLLQRIAVRNHRLDEPSQGIIVPCNRFEYLEAPPALDAIGDGELDRTSSARHPRCSRPAHPGRCLRRAVTARPNCCRDPLGRALFRLTTKRSPTAQLHRHRRLRAKAMTSSSAGARGRRHVAIAKPPSPSAPDECRNHRRGGPACGRSNGRKLGTVEEDSPRRSRPATTSFSPD